MPRFAANLGLLWPDRPLLARIEAAARAGFRAIEVHWPYDVPPEDVRALCARTGVTLLGLNTAPGDLAKGEFGLGALPGRQVEFQASLDRAIAYARASGASAIHVMAGNVAAAERGEARRVLIDNLRDAVRKAEPHGLTLLLEALNARDAPHYFYAHVEEAAQIIAAVASPLIRLQFDVFHEGVGGGDVLAKLARCKDVLGNVQIAAVPDRTEPDEGDIDYRAMFAALDALGYRGWVGCEYKPRHGTDEGLEWMRRLGVTASGN